MNFNYFSEGSKLPLVISPDTRDASKELLTAWISANKDSVEENLNLSGALLFRGFEIYTPDDFEAVARAIDDDLKNDYLGTSPRDKKTDFVFSASELPPHYPIMQHCEMSFLPSAPRRLFFYCHVEPPYGGETPICDFRKVYSDLDVEVRTAFETKGVKHIRNYSSPSDNSKSAFQLKKWNELFQTTDKSLVEQKCAENDIICEWKERDGLRMINKGSAIKIHPATGEKVWFNHTQVFHVSAAADEYQRIHRRQQRWETFKTNLLLKTLTVFNKITKDPMQQSMHVTFGDDSPIPDAYVEHIQDIIWKHLVIQPWKKGDVLCIDNFSTAHGRMPYYGPREIMVYWTS
jgi:alpha-ketoglutarate-dependent taurine dioxygenase